MPYGVYDVTANAGFVSLGITSDAEFAVEAIRTWLKRTGRKFSEDARLTVTADCGGSNGAASAVEGRIAETRREAALTLHVHHYPPGTSKWNKIEHRMFCHITQNWRGRPLTIVRRGRTDRRHDDENRA